MSSSCFKIISCGSRDSLDDDPDHLGPSSQGQGASDKRGWSFRKRSARHRVLSNTVTSEAHPSVNKDSPVSAATDFQRQPNSTIPEKISAVQYTEEKPKLSTPVSSILAETIVTKANDSKADASPDESVVIVVQSAIRAFLAREVLLKSKNVIKLQAAVRGHLVRRHAVGTLRCVQAIVKMQVLVRARRARILKEGSDAAEKPNQKIGKDKSLEPMGKEDSRSQHVTYVSMEKLLSNGFARQLLDSTPRTKTINIKCDPSKSDSAWKWLERWMSVTTMNGQPPLDSVLQDETEIYHTATQENAAVLPDGNEFEQDITLVGKCNEKEIEQVVVQDEMAVPSESNCNSASDPSLEVFERDENLITYDPERSCFQESRPTSPSLSPDLKQIAPCNTGETKPEEINSDALLTETRGPEFPDRRELGPIGDGAETGNEQYFQAAERISPEISETEEKKFIVGSRKASNPSFLAAHSKFEELSSVSNLTKSISSNNQTVEDESYADTLSNSTDRVSGKESSLVGAPKVQIGGSECGTELSISSTLDSPERLNEYEQEGKVLEDTNGHSESKDNLVVEAKVEPAILDSGEHNSNTVQPEIYSSTIGPGDGIDSLVSVDLPQVEQKPGADLSKLQVVAEIEQGNQVCKSSPEASPRSHVTGPEPQGTPSSEISVKPKRRTKGEKSGSNHKLRSSSAGKRSPSNPNNDSGAGSSTEQLHKDHKSGKRRNSFGSPKPDHVDQEPRDSSSSNPLPSYMQPTESARAKALLNSSPRSSPDVLDKDVFIKKRHSLPGANGRHGSPQIQRTTSQVQQTLKGNGSQSPQERKWRR